MIRSSMIGLSSSTGVIGGSGFLGSSTSFTTGAGITFGGVSVVVVLGIIGCLVFDLDLPKSNRIPRAKSSWRFARQEGDVVIPSYFSSFSQYNPDRRKRVDLLPNL